MTEKASGKDTAIGCLTVIALCGGLAFWMTRPSPPPMQGPPTFAEFEADLLQGGRGACREAVRQSLNDPGSAEWEPSDTWLAYTTSNDTVHIEPRLRAKNGFGALVYGEYVCEATLSGGQWTFTVLEQKID
jgi:hypothetical protein